MDLHAFKVSPKGYIYVRLDKLTNKYGCPSMDEIENFSNVYKERLDEIGERGVMPDDLGLQVSSPGAELSIPDYLDRLCGSYLEDNLTPNTKPAKRKGPTARLSLTSNPNSVCGSLQM